MIDLAAAQRAVYEALRSAADAPCFVRLCLDHGALWVSDLPRRTGRLVSAMAVLDALGVRYETDPATGLWRLDWTAESWRDRLDRLPACLPALPREEALHPAYALCRLLLLHPAPLESQPMAQVREVVKLAAGAPGPLLSAVPALAGESARRLRWASPWPKAADGCLRTGLHTWTDNRGRRG